MTPTRLTILSEWEAQTEEYKRHHFPTRPHREAADRFASNADRFRQKSGTFVFPIARHMSLTLTRPAIYAALKHNQQTAEALANVVTVDVGSRAHQAAVQTLLQLVWFKEKPTTPTQTKLLQKGS